MTTPALSQLAAVESDLRALSLESRKKYVEVKQAAEKAILKLRPLQETKIESECLEVLRSNVTIQPFLMACATKHSPLVIMSLNSMQRLSSCGALSAGSVAMLIGTLRILSESTQPDILLRILQTLSLLANPATFEAGEETIPQALGICFRLHVSEFPIIYNTAAATLQQVISLIFERAIKHQQNKDSESSSTSLGVTQITALRLFIDLVLLASGDPPQWLTSIHSEVPRTVLFESINAIIKNYSTFLQSHQYFIDVIRNQLRPFIMRLLTTNDFKICVRLIQIVANIIIYYHNCLIPECESFMSTLIRMLEPEFQLWQRVLVLEAFKLLTEIPSLLVAFHTNFDCGQRNTKIFASMAHALGRSANQITLEDDKVSMSVTLWQLHKEKSKGLDLLSENVTPDYDELYSVSLATNSLINIVNAIGTLPEKAGSDETLRSTLSSMLMSTWYPILAAFMMLLEHSHQDEQVQHYLLSFQSFCFTCAKLDRKAPLSEFVKSLCVLSLPPGFRNLNDRAFDLNLNSDLSQSTVSSKNLQSMKCLFNICHTCPSKLSKSWIVIFTTWEKLDLILSPNNKHSSPKPSPEFEVLTKALNGFLESTSTFDKEILMQVLMSLGSLSLSSLANSATTENSNSDPLRLFPMVYFVKALIANTFRIGFLWDFAVDHLSAVLHSKYAPIRAYGVQSIIRLVKSALKQLLDPNIQDNSNALQKEFGTSPAMYLKTFRPAMKGRFVENGNAILVSLYDILQTSGAHLGDGWPIVISLLDDVISLDVAEHVPFAFKIVQVIVDDFLEALDFFCYPNLVHTIGRYGRQRLVANISFTSIGLLWQVSDHLIRVRSGKKQQFSKDCLTDENSSDALQLILFSELEELSLDSRAELRNSAAQILHSTVAACGSYLSLQSWERCLTEILFKLYALLFRSDASKEALPSEVESGASLGTEDASGSKMMMISHYSRDTAEKQWDETRVHALQGSARIFRQFFRFHEGENGKATFIAYLKFIEDAICIYSSEVAHYAIESVRDILQSSLTISILQNHRELTDQILILFKNVVNKAMEVKHDVPFDVYTELLDCVSGLIGESGSHIFSAQDLLLFLQLADYLSSLVPTQAREPSTQGKRETSLQRATLLLIDRLIVVESPTHLYAAVLLQIIKYVAGAVLTDRTSSSLDLEAAHAFARRSMPVLSTLFCTRCPAEVQGRVDIVVPMLDSLRAIMTSASMSTDMIRVAVTSFNEIVPFAVIAVKKKNENEELTESFWSKLQETFSGFLTEMPSRSKTPAIQVDDFGLVHGNDHLIEFELMQVEMVKLFSEKVLPQLDGSFPILEREMLSVLMRDHQSTTVIGLKSWTSAHEPAGKILLMESGFNSLFDCVSRFPDGLGVHAIEILEHGCIKILHDFVDDDCRSGVRPLPEFRSRQVQLILKRLDLRADNKELSPPVENRSVSNAHDRGRKRLLLQIFPHLCRLTTIKDTQLQRALSRALQSVSEEIREFHTALIQNSVLS